MRMLFAALATAMLLVACGGGGGGGTPIWAGPGPGDPGNPGNPGGPGDPGNPGGPGGPGDPGNPGGPGTPPTPISAHYKYLSFEQDRDPDLDPPQKRFDAYIALLNREGAQGYRYIAGQAGGNIVRLQDNFMMVKDTETTYSYEYKTLEVDILHSDVLPRLLLQMKEQGAQGKVFIQFLPQMYITPPAAGNNPVFGILYRKDQGSSATYDFESIPYPQVMADFTNTANALGGRGFRPWNAPSTVTREKAQFFIKDLSSPARYELKPVISPLSVVGGEVKDVKAQIREQGALGYRLLKERFLEAPDGTRPSYILYLKDLTQASSFEYEFLDNPEPIFGLQEANAVQANGQTVNGLRYFGQPDSPIFFRSLNCTGPLCVSPTTLAETEE